MPDKPYFAKYLPVEGKIGIGDHVQHDIGITECETQEQVEFYQERGHKKVQLFLCSGNTKSGDTVYTDDEFKDPHKQYQFDDLDQEAIQKSYKMIGTISSGVYWVKEGDTFSEEEIKRDVLTKWYAGEDDYTEYVHHYPKGEEAIKIPSDEEFISEDPIKLKGPCGHFH